MRPTRKHLVIVMAVLGVLGVLWAVYAQEISLPPPIMQPEVPPPPKPPEKKAPTPAKYPFQTQPVREKPKADPTLIIPPDVFDVPHVLPGPTPVEGRPGLLLTDGVGVPPPLFPPAMPGKEAPPSVPVLDAKPIVLPTIAPPPPPPEPTKMLIDPLTLDPPGAPNPKKVQQGPPTLAFPPPTDNAPGPAVGRLKAFVRLRSAANDAPPPLDVVSGPPGAPGYYPPVPPPGAYAPNPNALLNLQTPAVGVEKRGPATLRAGETQTYEIVVRNLGTVPAQQVRIEEEIPAGAKFLPIGTAPNRVGSSVSWTVSALAPGGEQSLRFTLQAEIPLQLGASTSVHVAAMQPLNTTVLKQASATSTMAVGFAGPERAMVGNPVAFDIRVANQSAMPLTGVKLFGYLPEGLNDPQDRNIEMVGAITIPPGSFKILKMPATAVAPGRHTVQVKVVSSAGEAWATGTIDIAAASLTVHQPELTRLYLGRDGELRIDVTNGTGKPLRHVAVASLLPEGLDFLGASDRGLYQANHRTVYWIIDTMPAGQTQALSVRIGGARPGQYQNVVSVRADGVPEVRSTGAVALEGMASLKLRVVDRDNPLEVGKETVYEIQISNSGGAPAHNVRLQVQFAAGLVPRSADGNTRYSVTGQTVTFEPIPSLRADAPAIYHVSAHAQSAGDQRVRFSVVSDEVQVPLQREVSTRVY